MTTALHTSIGWTLGAVAGIAHAALLSCAQPARGRWRDGSLLRLSLAGTALAAAAHLGQLASACLAWLALFCVTLVAWHLSRRRSA